MIRSILVASVFTFLAVAPIHAATYYVAPDGTDTATSGTLDQPFKSLRYAVDQLNSGDTVYIRSGTYPLYQGNSRQQLNIDVDNVTLAKYPDDPELPVIQGIYHHDFPQLPFPYSENKFRAMVAIHGQTGVTLDSLDIRNSDGLCVSISNAQHITIKNSRVGICFGQAISVNGGSQHILVENNQVTAANLGQYWGDRNIPWGAAVRVRSNNQETGQNNRYITFRNNLIYRTYAEGMVIGIESDDVLVEGNIIYDAWGLLYYRERGERITIRNNIGFYTDGTTFWRGARGTGGRPGTAGNAPASGIVFANEHGDGIASGRISYVYNNLIINAGSGIDFWPQKDGAMEDTYIFNNTVIGSYVANYDFPDPCGIGDRANRTDCQWVGPPQDHSAQIFNNLSLEPQAGAADIIVGQSSGLDYTTNYWSSDSQTSVPSKVRSTTDAYNLTRTTVFAQLPQPEINYLANLANLELKSDYPGIDQSSPLPTGLPADINLTTDLFGCRRDAQPDIGAIEYGATNCDPSVTITPAANPTATPTVPAPQTLTVLDWLSSFLSQRLPITSIRY